MEDFLKSESKQQKALMLLLKHQKQKTYAFAN